MRPGRERVAKMNGDVDRQYVVRTVRSAGMVATFAVMILLSYGQGWAVPPYLIGFALSVVLLVLMDGFIRNIFSPERLGQGGGEAGRERRKQFGLVWFVAFALVKYPLVALLFYFLVRAWDIRYIMAMTVGFLTLHLVMGMRAMGRALTEGRKA